MKKIILNIFCLILLLTPRILPQQFSAGSPEWLVDMFFSKSSFPDKANYFAGEMLDDSDKPTIGEELNGKGEISFQQIKATNDENVFAVEVETGNETIDFYSYLVNDDDTWKIRAVRRFLLPAFIYSVRDSLSNLNTLTASDSVFLLSLRLFTASDRDLNSYLRANLENFHNLISSFNRDEKEKADQLLASVGCNAIYNDKKYPGCTFIQILKFETMEAGFIQAADAILLPALSFEEFIYLEEVVAGWYMYRMM